MDRVLRSAILNSNVIDVIQDNKRPFDELMSKYRCAIMEIETKFKVLNEQYSLQYDRNPIETIKTRLKSMESISRKLAQKGKSFSAKSMEENLDDIAGVRVICSFQEDIYTLAKCLLDQDDIELLETKDYIKNPKPSGYRSLHLIVRVPIFLQNEKCFMKVEVQLRTIAMDFWASLEHKLRYKKEIPEFEKDSLQKELFECAQMINTLDQRMEAVKNLEQTASKKMRLLKLFWSTLYLSAFTFGGGYVIVSLMKKKFVDELGWIDEEEMLDLVAIAQSTPGAIAVNGAIVVGYKLEGIIGVIAAIAGTIIPPFVIISVISFFYELFASNVYVQQVLTGMQAGVGAVIACVVFDMGSGIVRSKSILSMCIMIAAFVAGYVFNVNVVLIILA